MCKLVRIHSMGLYGIFHTLLDLGAHFSRSKKNYVIRIMAMRLIVYNSVRLLWVVPLQIRDTRNLD